MAAGSPESYQDLVEAPTIQEHTKLSLKRVQAMLDMDDPSFFKAMLKNGQLD